MIIDIRIEEAHARTWLRCLKTMIEQKGWVPRLTLTPDKDASETAIQNLLLWEKRINRTNNDHGSDPLSEDALLPLQTGEVADVIFDFTSAEKGNPGNSLHLRPRFSSKTDATVTLGEPAVLNCLMNGQNPLIEIEDVGQKKVVRSGTASLEAASGLGGGLDHIYSRVSILMIAAVQTTATATHKQLTPIEKAPSISRKQSGNHMLKATLRSLVRRVYDLSYYPSHWRIGWRYTTGKGVFEKQSLAGERWNVLTQPHDTFYADPFPFQWQGRHFIFFEELKHGTDKGVISIVEMGPEGPLGPARIVLEEPHHLSYPFLYEDEDGIWMIPESSTAGTVVAYRAVDFPFQWKAEKTLLSGIEAADATIIHHNDRLWMFVVTRPNWGGYSDTLEIFHAPTLLGDWKPHMQNPVLVDHRTARPAGNMIKKDGRLWRPVQDCQNGYGAALGLAEVTTLTEETFEQKTKIILTPNQYWPGRKLHTLNRAGTLEVIDGCTIHPRSKLLSALVAQRYRPR